MTTPWDEEQQRLKDEAEEREAKQAILKLISEPKILPENILGNDDYDVKPEELHGIPDFCKDEAILRRMNQWATDVRLYIVSSYTPVPGPSKEWVVLLKLIQDAPKINFPADFAEQLKPWIPSQYWEGCIEKS